VQTSFTIIETRLSSSGQKNMLVTTGADINSLTEPTSPCHRQHLPSAMRSQDYSRPLGMGGCSVRCCRWAKTLLAVANLTAVRKPATK
jgi:hypothetical protein